MNKFLFIAFIAGLVFVAAADRRRPQRTDAAGNPVTKPLKG